MADEDIKLNTVADLIDGVASGEVDKEVLEYTMKGIQFMQFIMSYAELHDFDMSVVLTASTNIPIIVAGKYLDMGEHEDAFSVIDTAIETLQSGKAGLMERFNEQTDEFCVPPTV